MAHVDQNLESPNFGEDVRVGTEQDETRYTNEQLDPSHEDDIEVAQSDSRTSSAHPLTEMNVNGVSTTVSQVCVGDESSSSGGIIRLINRKKLIFIRLKDWEEERVTRYTQIRFLLDPVREQLHSLIGQAHSITQQISRFLREIAKTSTETAKSLKLCNVRSGTKQSNILQLNQTSYTASQTSSGIHPRLSHRSSMDGASQQPELEFTTWSAGSGGDAQKSQFRDKPGEGLLTANGKVSTPSSISGKFDTSEETGGSCRSSFHHPSCASPHRATVVGGVRASKGGESFFSKAKSFSKSGNFFDSTGNHDIGGQRRSTQRQLPGGGGGVAAKKNIRFFSSHRSEPFLLSLIELNQQHALQMDALGVFIDQDLVQGHLRKLYSQYEKNAARLFQKIKTVRGMMLKNHEQCVNSWSSFESLYKECERGEFETLGGKPSKRMQCSWLAERRYIFVAQKMMQHEKEYTQILIHSINALQQLEDWRCAMLKRVLHSYALKFQSSLNVILTTVHSLGFLLAPSPGSTYTGGSTTGSGTTPMSSGFGGVSAPMSTAEDFTNVRSITNSQLGSGNYYYRKLLKEQLTYLESPQLGEAIDHQSSCTNVGGLGSNYLGSRPHILNKTGSLGINGGRRSDLPQEGGGGGGAPTAPSYKYLTSHASLAGVSGNTDSTDGSLGGKTAARQGGFSFVFHEPFCSVIHLLNTPPIPPSPFIIKVDALIERLSSSGSMGVFTQKWVKAIAVLTWDKYFHVFKLPSTPKPYLTFYVPVMEIRRHNVSSDKVNLNSSKGKSQNEISDFEKPFTIELREKRKILMVSPKNFIFKPKTFKDSIEWVECLNICCDTTHFSNAANIDKLESVSQKQQIDTVNSINDITGFGEPSSFTTFGYEGGNESNKQDNIEEDEQSQRELSSSLSTGLTIKTTATSLKPNYVISDGDKVGSGSQLYDEHLTTQDSIIANFLLSPKLPKNSDDNFGLGVDGRPLPVSSFIYPNNTRAKIVSGYNELLHTTNELDLIPKSSQTLNSGLINVPSKNKTMNGSSSKSGVNIRFGSISDNDDDDEDDEDGRDYTGDRSSSTMNMNMNMNYNGHLIDNQNMNKKNIDGVNTNFLFFDHDPEDDQYNDPPAHIMINPFTDTDRESRYSGGGIHKSGDEESESGREEPGLGLGFESGYFEFNSTGFFENIDVANNESKDT